MRRFVPAQVQFHAIERYLERVRGAPCRRDQLNNAVRDEVVEAIRRDLAGAVEVPIEAHLLFEWPRGGTRPQRILRKENSFFIMQGNAVVTIIVFDELMMATYDEIVERSAA